LFSGTKGTGKTYRSLHVWAREQIRATRYPLLVVDPQLVETLAHLYHAASAKEALARVVVTGEPTAYKPKSEKDYDALVRGVHEAKEIIFLTDEVRFFVNARHVSDPLVELARVERNAKVPLAFTTQSYGDVGRELTCVVDAFVLFRHTATQDLDAIAARFGKDVRDHVEFLPDREFVYREMGKRYEKIQAPPAAPPVP
jgi:DNA-binding transcriptional regulator YbjK